MPAKVLIVDDEKDFLDIMAERLGARGMEVSTATSAENALKMVLKESFDAVIMDLMMPEMDGFKALKLFKETRPDLPIILLTANVPEEKCIEAIKLRRHGCHRKTGRFESPHPKNRRSQSPESEPF